MLRCVRYRQSRNNWSTIREGEEKTNFWEGGFVSHVRHAAKWSGERERKKIDAASFFRSLKYLFQSKEKRTGQLAIITNEETEWIGGESAAAATTRSTAWPSRRYSWHSGMSIRRSAHLEPPVLRDNREAAGNNADKVGQRRCEHRRTLPECLPKASTLPTRVTIYQHSTELEGRSAFVGLTSVSFPQEANRECRTDVKDLDVLLLGRARRRFEIERHGLRSI